jgi:hypothetical protein
MIVTPNPLPEAGPISRAQLSDLGNPTVTLEESDFTAFSAAAGVRPNLLINPDLSQWSRGAGPVNCAVTVKTLLADEWWVRPRFSATIPGSPSSTVAFAYQREAESAGLTVYRARMSYTSGAVGEVGPVEFGQDVPARITANWTSDGCTVTADLENQTGTGFVPVARFYQNAATDTWTDNTATLAASVNGTPASGSSTLANGERKVYKFTFTAAALAGVLRKGGEICIVTAEAAAGAGFVRVHGILKLETGQTGTTRFQEREATPAAGSSGSGSAVDDLLINGDLAPGLFTSNGGNVSCGVGETTVALGWTVINTAGTVTSARDTTVPNTLSGSSLKVTGDATATSAIVLAQRVYRGLALVAQTSLAWQAEIRNGTGADLVPVLVVKTCDNADDFSAVTERVRQALTTVGNGDWVRETHVIDAASVTNWTNGAVIEIEFPANSLDSTGKNVRVAQASLVPGSDTATVWVPAPALHRGGAVPLVAFENLRVDGLVNTATVTWDAVVLLAIDGRARRYGPGTCAIDNSTSGAGGLDTGSVANNTEYHLWLLGNDSGIVGICSLSATAPTGDALNYPFRGRISSVITDTALGAWRKFWQSGRRVHVDAAAVAYTPSDANFHSLSLAAYVPSTATAVFGTLMQTTGSAKLQACLAAHSWDGTTNAGGAFVFNLANSGSYTPAAAGAASVASAPVPDVGLRTAQNVYVACTTSGSPTIKFQIGGYVL